jgi:hypothetical protein
MAFGKLKVSDLFSFSHEIYPLLKLQYIMENVSVMLFALTSSYNIKFYSGKIFPNISAIIL